MSLQEVKTKVSTSVKNRSTGSRSLQKRGLIIISFHSGKDFDFMLFSIAVRPTVPRAYYLCTFVLLGLKIGNIIPDFILMLILPVFLKSFIGLPSSTRKLAS